MLDGESFLKQCPYFYPFYLRYVAHKSESVHEGSHIACVLTPHYVVIFRRPASVKCHAWYFRLWMTTLSLFASAVCVKGTCFMRYASLGKECRKYGGIVKIVSVSAGGGQDWNLVPLLAYSLRHDGR